MGRMKQIALPIFAFLLLTGCSSSDAADPKSLVSVAKDNVKKAEKYHKLTADAKVAQAQVQTFVAGWIEDCKVLAKTTNQPLVLQMGQDGDPGCTVQQTPAPQASAPPPQPANSPASTSPITPHKQ
jgi:PBP1b-binding outer membrane lipoprotein LpoB